MRVRVRAQVFGSRCCLASLLLNCSKEIRACWGTSHNVFSLMSQLSLELIAELRLLLRTAYQGCLGVRVCVCVFVCAP